VGLQTFIVRLIRQTQVFLQLQSDGIGHLVEALLGFITVGRDAGQHELMQSLLMCVDCFAGELLAGSFPDL
jgi:hypothetical protein